MAGTSFQETGRELVRHRLYGDALASWACVESTFLMNGMTSQHVVEVRDLLECTFVRSGVRGFSQLLKSWAKATKAILSGNRYDTSHAGYTKAAQNCKYRLRAEGMRDRDIDSIAALYGTISGIPPFLLFREFHRVLLPERRYCDIQKVASFVTIGRAAPPACAWAKRQAVEKFEENVKRRPPHVFDFSEIGIEIGMWGARRNPPHSTRISLNSHAALGSPRSQGGKFSEYRDLVMYGFMMKPLVEVVPRRPLFPLVDITGNVFLRPEDWDDSSLVRTKCYLDASIEDSGQAADERAGLFGLLWAVMELLKCKTLTVVSEDMPLPGLGSQVPPEIRVVSGYVDASVTILPEAGYKARVITITPLWVSIIGSATRHLLDPMIWADKMTEIGLLSDTKLYSFLAELNGGVHDGLVSNDISRLELFKRAESVDLTTATDTPHLDAVSSILEGAATGYTLDQTSQNLAALGTSLSTSRRRFLLPGGKVIPSELHNSGIMMGEGLSGTYLNLMSTAIRFLVRQSEEYFDWYTGNSIAEADAFIENNVELIQEFLDGNGVRTPYEPDRFSSQSGDDALVFVTHSLEGNDRTHAHLVLLYRVMGHIPSDSTFYSSGEFATFCENIAVKTCDSNGWTYVPLIKSRCWRATSTEGPDKIVSRITAITEELLYQCDPEIVEAAGEQVDALIASHPVLRQRIARYRLTLGLPEQLGGIMHPRGILPYFPLYLDESDRSLIQGMVLLKEEDLLVVQLAYLYDDLPEDSQDYVRQVLSHASRMVSGWETATLADGIVPLHCYRRGNILRQGCMSYKLWTDVTERMAQSWGLISFRAFAQQVSAGIRTNLILNGEEPKPVNVFIRRRNRRSFLQKKIGLLPQTWQDVTNVTIQTMVSRLQMCEDRYFRSSDLLDVCTIEHMPSFLIHT